MQARALVLTLAVCLASLPGSVGKDADLDLYPDPRKYPDGCGRTGLATSLVCDPSSVLVQDEADRVDVVARSPPHQTALSPNTVTETRPGSRGGTDAS